MSNELYEQIRLNFDSKETDELVTIWTTNDRVVWSDTAFEVLKDLLEERLDELPPQNEPVLVHVKPKVEKVRDAFIPANQFTDPNNAPSSYKPRDVYWMEHWFKKASIAAIIITVLVCIPKVDSFNMYVRQFLPYGTVWNLVSWLITLVLDGFATALQCFIYYFSFRALASILKILMEMEFNSRQIKS